MFTPMDDPTHYVRTHLEGSRQVMEDLFEACGETIEEMASEAIQVIEQGGTIYLCGNGGSAADAQHFAAELIGRYESSREAAPAVAFTTDTSVLTAVANDMGYENVFRRQVQANVTEQDLLIGLSTSGTSGNVLRAAEAASDIGAVVHGWTGKEGGDLPSTCDRTLRIPSDRTSHIQEGHAVAGHIICGLVEEHLASEGRERT